MLPSSLALPDLATRLLHLATATVAVLAALGCGGRDPEPPAADAPAEPVPARLELVFERPAGSRDFDVIATVLDASGAPLAGPAITLEADRGTLGPSAPDGAGVRARVTAAGTGHHAITARAGELESTRVALVLGTVGDEWGQPEPVRGLVNTAGWEDGASISPDGEVLTVQYLPVPINCVLGLDPAAPACRVKGPVTAPERPRMPGASRVNADGTYHNGCPSLGIPSLPVPAPPNAVYAFTRQADGSFAAPRPVYFDGIDGCVSAFGFELQADGTAVYAFDDPRFDDEARQLHVATVDRDADIVLGRFAIEGGAIVLRDVAGAEIALTDTSHQGNPHLLERAGGGRTLVYDDENARADLLFVDETAGGWGTGVVIPAPVSEPGVQESQPFFDGQALLFRRELDILAADWNGGPMGDAGSWTAPRVVLAGAPSTEVGAVIGVGEPSVTAGPRRELYFIYVRNDADGTLQLDAGRVAAR